VQAINISAFQIPQKLAPQQILLAIIACLLWSTAFVGIKTGLHYSKPLSFAGIRFMLSGVMLLPFTGGMTRYFQLVRVHWWILLKVGLLQTFLVYGLFYSGMTIVPGALAAVIIGSSPLITAIIAHFRMPGDELTVPKTMSMLLGVAGVVVIGISRHPWEEAGFGQFVGILILLASSVSGAFGNITVAQERSSIPPVILNSAQIFLGGLLLFVLSLPLEGLPRFNHPPVYWAALFYLAFVSAAAFSIWFSLLKTPGIKVSSLNLWKFLIPVLGATFSWILLSEESPELFTIIGMLCVALSIIAYNICLLANRCD
jgi:drug/metabolite transporter (DMT)-like permease